MCTLTFVPTKSEFRVAMNRDEKRVRVAALPPERFDMGTRQVLYPREPGGGTWLAVNDAGLCLALINWHRIKKEPLGGVESRGHVIPQLIGAADSVELKRKLQALPLQALRPFRLIVIDRRSRSVIEWQWNTRLLAVHRFDWRVGHWFSSGYNEVEAEKLRGKVCRHFSLGRRHLLRHLHASHLPERGPFSICMHRTDGVTVSYSEVLVTNDAASFHYLPGAPCQESGATSWTTRKLTLQYP